MVSKLIASEQYVQRVIHDRFGLHLIKIDDMGGEDGQEPDFEYRENDQRIFVCELKEYAAINPSEKEGWKIIHHSDGSVGYTRDSKAPNKISRNIHKAYQQLKKYSEPKILIFFNHYPGYDVRDVEDTYRGFCEYKIGDRIIRDLYYKKASEGDIKDEKTLIDLYIWIDASDKNGSLDRDEIYLRSVTDIGQEIARKYFCGLDKA